MMERDERLMSVARSNKDERLPPAGNVPVRRSLASRALRNLLRAVALTALAVAILFPLGFLWFVFQVPDSEVPLTRNADGIVVLTGGASRVNDAFELLASRRGQRLLITGVYPATNPGEISRVLPE